MWDGNYSSKPQKLYYLKKLKWYQWILQKLHIKNYWVEIKGVERIALKGSDKE